MWRNEISLTLTVGIFSLLGCFYESLIPAAIAPIKCTEMTVYTMFASIRDESCALIVVVNGEGHIQPVLSVGDSLFLH